MTAAATGVVIAACHIIQFQPQYSLGMMRIGMVQNRKKEERNHKNSLLYFLKIGGMFVEFEFEGT